MNDKSDGKEKGEERKDVRYADQLRLAASMVGASRKKRQSSSSSTSSSTSAVPDVRPQNSYKVDEKSCNRVSVRSMSPEPVSPTFFLPMDIGDEPLSLQPNEVPPVLSDGGLENAYAITGYTPTVPRLNPSNVGIESALSIPVHNIHLHMKVLLLMDILLSWKDLLVDVI